MIMAYLCICIYGAEWKSQIKVLRTYLAALAINRDLKKYTCFSTRLLKYKNEKLTVHTYTYT